MNHATSTNCIFPIRSFTQVRERVLNWANRFSTFCFLDNHQYKFQPQTSECILAAGVKRFVRASAGDALAQLQRLIEDSDQWLFGHLGYDLKNETEGVHCSHPDGIRFPDLFFFQPEVLIQFDTNDMSIQSEAGDEERIFRELMATEGRDFDSPASIRISNRIERDEYISIIQKLKHHISRGDCYEINFCQEFFAQDVFIDPQAVYSRLSALSPNPFSAFYRLNDKYLICASPERFLKKSGSRLLSQPIKGTSKRWPCKLEDEEAKSRLFQSDKERSENVMIVDLVRNDLSKICEQGTVKVEELFSIYSFPQVHQMVSTVSGKLRDSIPFSDIIRSTFPMGSMTGAPKKRVLELIAQFEKTKRGIFSGALGYIDPAGDFDFNVVIRSVMYNAGCGYLSFQTGSAITFHSDPVQEWEECMLKAKAMRQVLAMAQEPDD